MAICFVAFALLRILRYRHFSMHGGKEPLCEAQILSELSAVEVSVLRDQGTGKRYVAFAATGRQQINLYKAVGLTLQRSTVLLKEESGEQLSWTALLSCSKDVLLCSNKGIYLI